MRIAVIDCGTNTFNLLVADASPQSWQVVFQNKLPVKLGAGGFEDHTIVPARFIRGLDALQCHSVNSKNFKCERVFAFATSGIREATNGQDFIAKSKSLFNVDIELISGDREAELIYDGVRQTQDFGDEKVLIMDIGGGSTEFIIADGKTIFWKHSFLLGVSRLHDLVKPEDKMSEIDLNYIERLLTTELESLKEGLEKFPVKKLIGSSGSFDTLLALFLQRNGKDSGEVPLFNEIPLSGYKETHRWLLNSTFDERVRHPAIPSIRAEFMPLASCLVKHVLEMHHFDSLHHSGYSLKEGAMQEILSRINWPATPIEDEKPEDYLEE